MTPPESEARKPTLTSTTVMRRPLLWRCSMTNMSSPTTPWTKSEEKRHHRNTQYHISDRGGIINHDERRAPKHTQVAIEIQISISNGNNEGPRVQVQSAILFFFCISIQSNRSSFSRATTSIFIDPAIGMCAVLHGRLQVTLCPMRHLYSTQPRRDEENEYKSDGGSKMSGEKHSVMLHIGILNLNLVAQVSN